MSAYPPPPPPGPYPPAYDRFAAKQQRQAIKAQVRLQQAQQRALRHQMRAQRRSLRRSSIVGPVIILAIGVVFLLAQLGKLSWSQSLEWYGRWWPAVLIAAGVMLLIEWAIDQKRADSAVHARVIGGGVIFLLILIALTGLSARGIEYGLDWHDHAFGNNSNHWDHLFGDRHDADSSMNSPLASGTPVIIRNPHGDIIVTGSSSDGQIHVSVHTQTYAWKDYEAEEKSRKLQPVFTSDSGVLSLSVSGVDGGEADLTIEMPRNSPLTIQANHGDLTVNEMSAPLTLTANHGDVDISGIDNAVTLHINDDNASVTMHSIHGPVTLQGHSGDIDISDITGDVAFQGDFFGTTHLAHVNGAVHFETSRTHFSAARLDDDLSIDRGSLEGTALMGPLVLKTVDKNITLDRIQGSVDLSNSNGTVELTNAAPLDTITIQNRRGSVDLGLAGSGGFSLNAQTHNGDMENDFGLSPVRDDDNHTLRGQVATGGPTVTIATTDGDVTVRRSTIASLPPTPPVAPRITTAPPPPAPTAAPRAPHKLKTPAAPPAPSAANSTF